MMAIQCVGAGKSLMKNNSVGLKQKQYSGIHRIEVQNHLPYIFSDMVVL